ncbi:iron chaperone [Dermabacter hominis]|uniref:iron chaperone n=1 Tax=Dermabacter hominis TaxID=36740 RepID=UPI0021A5CD2A|nr:DUF1801 domain-containing protein [Dermabacter hominis]MCT1717537.1 DUF1801 domain-containing protein [Dermabacter hominis]MCT1790155.1 DUF1801 domain-containing protein [Dermabacter hominis]MDU6927319.1 DUF1801 domain-containing protein [Dermabacter sp.]
MTIRTLNEFLDTVPDGPKRERMIEVLEWVQATYPDLEMRIAWSTPMFTHHGTFIVGFSAAKMHMSVSPEKATMQHFEDLMEERGTDRTAMLARQPWSKPFDYELLAEFIDYQIVTKKDVTTFWRP